MQRKGERAPLNKFFTIHIFVSLLSIVMLIQHPIFFLYQKFICQMPYRVKSLTEKVCTGFHFFVSELIGISVFDFLAIGTGMSRTGSDSNQDNQVA